MNNRLNISKIKKPIAYRFCAMVAGVSISLFASAAPDEQPSSLSLSQAVTMTLNLHPDVKALVSQEAVLDGRIRQAGIGDRPEIGLMIEDGVGTGNYSGVKSAQTTLSYSWVLQQALLDSRVNAAESEVAALDAAKKIKALDLSAIVARHYIDYLVKQERLRLFEMAERQAEEVVDAIAKRVDAGKSSTVEMELARAELIRRQLAVEDIRHEIKASLYQLTALWGEAGKAYTFSGDLRVLPEVPSVETQLALLKQHPNLQRFVSEQRIAQSQVELARIEAKPQWQFSAGLRRYETTNDFGFVAGVSVPWGDTNRNAGKIASLQAQQNVLASEQAAMMQKLDAQLYVLLQEMAHSHHVIETIQTAIVPTLERALSQASDAFDKGQLNYNQYNNVRQELLDAQSQLLDAYENLHLEHIEIQRLTGTSISKRNTL